MWTGATTAFSRSRFVARNFSTRSVLLGLCHHHAVNISGHTVQHRIRDMDSLKSVIEIPMEAELVALDPAQISIDGFSNSHKQLKQLKQFRDSSY
jgi:hypothetical protein